MATFGLLALTFGPCIAVCAWLLSHRPTKEELAADRRSLRENSKAFFSDVGMPKSKRAEAIKAFLAHQAKVRQYAKDHPDEFQ